MKAFLFVCKTYEKCRRNFWCFPIWALEQQPMTEFGPLWRSYDQTHDQQLPEQLHRQIKGLCWKKTCFAQNDCLTQWQNITHENTFWKLIFSSPSAAMADDLVLTVANPQSTLLIFSMDSTASLPSSSSVGSLVARYRYIALSISSAKHPNICQHKHYQTITQQTWAIPWTNLKILQHNQVNSLACLAMSTDFPFPKDVLQKKIPLTSLQQLTTLPLTFSKWERSKKQKRLILSCQS